MVKKIKILIPILGFGKQGGYRVLSNFANYWIEMGHEVAFLSISDSIVPYFPTSAKIYWINETGLVIKNQKREKKVFMRFFRDIFNLYKGLNLLKNEGFDVVIANLAFTTFPVKFSQIKALKVYYIQADETEYMKKIHGWKNKLLIPLCNASYRLNLYRIVNAPLYLKYKNIKANDFVLPGLDFKIFFPKNKQTEHPPKKNVILGCVGRIEPYKGTQDVLDAFIILQKQEIDVELRVAFGDESLKDTSKLIVCTPTNDNELADFYRSIDILIAPGTVQLGAVHYPVIEAMACGTTVITTGYYPSDNSNSWIVPVHNPKAISEAVLGIINSNTDDKTQKAIMDIRHMSWENTSTKMIECFDKKLNTIN